MSYKSFSDWDTFLRETSGRIFRMWVFKRMFTPFEREKKYMDESIYEDNTCTHVIIRESIVLPNGDILLGLQSIFDEDEIETSNYDLSYYKLSEVRLSFIEGDNDFNQ